MFYQSSPETVEGFERKFEEMWARVTNTSPVVAEARLLDDSVVNTTDRTGNSDKPDRH